MYNGITGIKRKF